MAGPHRHRQLSKREVTEPRGRHLFDRRIEQPLTWLTLYHPETVPDGTDVCTIRYMPRPVVVTIDVPQPPDAVFDHLDVMANHESFNDHLMTDWVLSGPERGVGSRARVHTKVMGMSDIVEFEVTEAERPRRIVERNTAVRAQRIGQGTYTLEPATSGSGTRITFEYDWIVTPLIDRLTAPLTRAYLRRNNTIAMQRLAQDLAGGATDSPRR